MVILWILIAIIFMAAMFFWMIKTSEIDPNEEYAANISHCPRAGRVVLDEWDLRDDVDQY